MVANARWLFARAQTAPALLAGLLLLAALPAQAQTGVVRHVDGLASIVRAAGEKTPAVQGLKLQVGDRIETGRGARVRIELEDGSVLAVDEASILRLDAAAFEERDRQQFLGFLSAGRLWAKVKRSLRGGKFEIATERAVAGVRGTVFRVDAAALLQGARGGRVSTVRVLEGVVAVAPSEAVRKASGRGNAAPKRPAAARTRVQVEGPQEVTLEGWETRVALLQKGMQIAVGVDLWEQAVLAQQAQKDAFDQWIEKTNP